MFFSASKLAVFGLASIAQAHVLMVTPAPFSGTISSPLDAQGVNFPCQGQSTAPAGGSTTMPLGSSQSLSFMGSAVHGGGSCQVSITYDKAPTKDSVWKVIHSIHGGCPMRHINGNNGNDATLMSPDTYSFTIPTDLPTGQAVLAWTWFNKIGNREMYMNCAPITITGGSARRDETALAVRESTELVQRDQAAYNALPNMFKANIGNCVTIEGINLLFPNPGSSIERNTDSNPFDAPPAACIAANGGSGSPAPPAQTAAPTSAAGPAPTKASLPGGVFITVSPPGQDTPVATTTPVQATTLTVIPTKATAVPPPASTGASGALSGPCATEGQWNCISGSSFQQCGSGSWSTPQQLAAGTKCTPGVSAAIDIQAIAAKRGLRFSGAHIRRHLRNSAKF